MNPLDLLMHDPQFRMGVRMERYGRIIKPDTGEIVSNHWFPEEKTVGIVDFIEHDEGCETWFDGGEYPARGCFQNERVVETLRVKRMFMVLFKTIKSPLDILYLKKNWKHFLDLAEQNLLDVKYPDVKYYSQPVREIYRKIPGGSDRFLGEIRNVICCSLEFDTAYRYRAQDILPEFIRENLEKNPLKEFKRVADILFQRESDGGMGRFKKISKLLWIYLWFNRKLLNAIKDFILNLDMEEIKLSKEDIYWTKIVPYNYQFNYG